MNRITSVIKRYPLASYFALAYAVIASTDGRAGIRGLFRAESNVICSLASAHLSQRRLLYNRHVAPWRRSVPLAQHYG